MKILAFVIIGMFFKAVLSVNRTRKSKLLNSFIIMPIVAASIFNEDIRFLLKSNIKLWHSYIVVLLIVLYVSV